MEPAKIDALLSMMQLDELEEAGELISEWVDAGYLTPADAEQWQRRIAGWSAARSSERSQPLAREMA